MVVREHLQHRDRGAGVRRHVAAHLDVVVAGEQGQHVGRCRGVAGEAAPHGRVGCEGRAGLVHRCGASALPGQADQHSRGRCPPAGHHHRAHVRYGTQSEGASPGSAAHPLTTPGASPLTRHPRARPLPPRPRAPSRAAIAAPRGAPSPRPGRPPRGSLPRGRRRRAHPRVPLDGGGATPARSPDPRAPARGLRCPTRAARRAGAARGVPPAGSRRDGAHRRAMTSAPEWHQGSVHGACPGHGSGIPRSSDHGTSER